MEEQESMKVDHKNVTPVYEVIFNFLLSLSLHFPDITEISKVIVPRRPEILSTDDSPIL